MIARSCSGFEALRECSAKPVKVLSRIQCPVNMLSRSAWLGVVFQARAVVCCLTEAAIPSCIG